MTCTSMQPMFRKMTKGLEQNLSVICKDSILQLFCKNHQSINSVTPRNTLIVEFHFNKLGCCKLATLSKKAPSQFILEFGEFSQISIKNNSC